MSSRPPPLSDIRAVADSPQTPPLPAGADRGSGVDTDASKRLEPARRDPGTPCARCRARIKAAALRAGYRDVIIAAVLAVDSDLPADVIGEVVERATPHREQRRVLAIAVSTDAAWCAGSTAAPVAVERLVAVLCELGSTRFRMPCCGECGRAAHCVGRRPDGARLCKACDHRRRTIDCVMCGRHRPAGGLLADGTPTCAPCRRAHPERLELAAELPAAFLADLLGISAGTAVRWTKASGGKWANYAAVRARTPCRR